MNTKTLNLIGLHSKPPHPHAWSRWRAWQFKI